MAVDNTLKVTKSTGQNFDPIPEGTYQVEIVDVKQVTRETKYGIKDKFQFNCAVVEGEYKDRLVFVSVNVSWFNGEGGRKASSLFNLIKTIYTYYEPKTDISQIDEVTGQMVNDLQGKQFIAVVKVNDVYNNVTDYLKITKPVKYEAESNGNEDVDPDSVPEL